VLDAIKAGDGELAARVMLEHVVDIEDCLFAGN
jgi:DNA-binding GntR family transcriptional regulator